MSTSVQTNPSTQDNVVVTEMDKYHPLSNKWTLYAHLPHETDWSVQSYKRIHTITTLEEAIALNETLPDIMVKNCMLFLMKDNIKPIWEDPMNEKGGCFSYKVHNQDVYKGWKNLFYHIIGETISENKKFRKSITGITISPKKNFCIIKIWMSDCLIQSTSHLVDVSYLDKNGVIFKKHKGEPNGTSNMNNNSNHRGGNKRSYHKQYYGGNGSSLSSNLNSNSDSSYYKHRNGLNRQTNGFRPSH